MSECAKRGCSYYWQEEGEAYPRCHWESRCPGDVAPCDEDDVYYADEPESEWEWDDDPNLEMGFDPYEGGYTWDC